MGVTGGLRYGVVCGSTDGSVPEVPRLDWERARRADSVRRAPADPPKRKRLTRGSFGSGMTPTQKARFYGRGAPVTVSRKGEPTGT